MRIRSTLVEDVPALKLVADETGLFPSNILSDLVLRFLSKAVRDEIWLTVEVQRQAVGFCYATHEKLTDGTWNMLAIAVLPSKQGEGLGSAMVKSVEDLLRTRGHRLLVVDTSGTDKFKRTRQFYRNCGYVEEARIRDFWAAGDDKVIFRKVL